MIDANGLEAGIAFPTGMCSKLITIIIYIDISSYKVYQTIFLLVNEISINDTYHIELKLY